LKRIIIWATAVGALVLATMAFAAVKHFRGSITDCGASACGTVNLNARFKQHKARSVRHFTFNQWLTHCDDGDIRITNEATGGFGPMAVRKRHFSGDFGTSTDTHITGVFSKTRRRVHGTIDFQGDVVGTATTHTNCTAGPDKYSAHVTP
jgi:hypothetical protein